MKSATTIGLVDDEPGMLKALQRLLNTEGYHIRTFASASEFLDRFADERVDCLVLDVTMPGLSGLELQQQRNRAGARLPIVFLTGQGDIPMSVRAIKAGAVNFLTKPVDDAELLAAVRAALAEVARQQVEQDALAADRVRLETLTPRELEVLRHVTSQWNPALFEGTKPIEPPHDAKNYFFDQDMADHGIDWIRMQHATAPGKPFLAYYAPGTAHAPHHAPPDWIAKFKGQFDQGWDKVRAETFARQKALGIIPANAKLTERSPGIPAWDSLTADQKKVYAHMMEVYAAALAHCDHQMGRLLDAIEAQGELDNTLVIYIQGDNGASGEGGMQGLLNEMTFFNGIPEDFKEVLRRMNELGGPHTIVYDFKYDGPGLGKGGVGTIQVDGKTVATGRIERTLAFRLSLDETLDCGEDTGTPVSEDYHTPFKFTGELKQATINLKPVPLTAADQQKLHDRQTAIAVAQ